MNQWVSAGDGQKLAIYVVAIIAFYAIARWVSSRTESSQIYQPPQIPEPPPVETLIAPQAPPPVRTDPVETVILDDIWFDNFDVKIGPPDPKRFCSEMTATVRIPGYYERKWDTTVPVATPEGIRDKIQNERWSSLYMPDLIVVDHYDLKEICDTLIDHILSRDPDTTLPPDNPRLDSIG
jgi:hypothetical protein